jgi:chromate transport protein ChrA
MTIIALSPKFLGANHLMFMQPMVAAFLAFSVFTMVKWIKKSTLNYSIFVVIGIIGFLLNNPILFPVGVLLAGLISAKFNRYELPELPKKEPKPIVWKNLTAIGIIFIIVGGIGFILSRNEEFLQLAHPIVLFENTYRIGALSFGGGNKPIAVTYYGVRHTTANKAINKPEDMKGLKIRVPDAPLYTMFPRGTGANPTPIAFAEVYLALQNKTVDAQENPLPTIEAKKFYEVQSHINLTGHITEMLLTIVSGATWNKLSDADKKAFEAIFKEAGAKATDEIAAAENKLVDEFTTKYKKMVVKTDRKPFQEALTKLHLGPDATWDRATYEKLQALK